MVQKGTLESLNKLFPKTNFKLIYSSNSYAGTKGMINANAIYSSQWAGIEGSPKTQSISVEGPVNDKVGLGIHIINDHIGAQSQQGLFGSYSYKIQVNNKYKLSLGLALGLSYLTLDGTKLTTDIQDDPAIPKTLKSKLRLDSKFGSFFYSERFYAGFSINDLFANVKKSNDLFVATQARHTYITTGYVFDINPKLKLKPSFLFKTDFKAQSNIDLSSNFLINDKLWLGASIKFGSGIFKSKDLDKSLKHRDAIVFMTEYNVTDRFIVGYAYTLSTSVLKKYPGHEFVLEYYFPEKIETKMRTPRYF